MTHTTQISDAALAAKVNAFVAANPTATRSQIIRGLNTGNERIARLHAEGLIHTLPRKLTPSEIGRRVGRPGWVNFKLPGSMKGKDK